MYSREYRKYQPASNSHDPQAPNQFAPRRNFLQPQKPKITPPDELERIKHSEGNYFDSSIITNRPPRKEPQIQLKRKLNLSTEENQTPKPENQLSNNSQDSKEIATGIAQEAAITRFTSAAKTI